ncbi:MAG: ATP-binding protein [Nitrospirota bacterium]
MRPHLPIAMNIILILFLLLSSAAIVYITAQNAHSVQNLAIQALESTALAISSSAEVALKESGNRSDSKIREILSDRVVAYAFIADKNGTVLFHTNPRLVGSNLSEAGLSQYFQSEKASGRRITLKTGIPAYEFNYILHNPEGTPEMLRLVLHTSPSDKIVSNAMRMWWIVSIVIILLWTLGILLGLTFFRYIRLQKQTEQRKQMVLIGQMASVLAHEIRNALGGIKGYTQWVNEKIEDTDPKKKGLEMVLKGTNRIESLVSDLLQFSREETYKIENIEIYSLIEEVITLSVSSWKGKVNLDIESDLKVKADKEKLFRVLLNGVQNAIQSMGEDGNLDISAHKKGLWVTIQIDDTGMGIPESEFTRLFTPFYTTKTTGTGLGLIYSKKVVEGMGGQIYLSNRNIGSGAVLSIQLLKSEDA